MTRLAIEPAEPVVVADSVPESEWMGLRPTWTGWDGSVFDLANRDGGVLLKRTGTRGLSMPPRQRYKSDSPGVNGARYRGGRFLERDVFWPLSVSDGESSQRWVARDRAFWRTMHPDRPGVWRVTHPDGTSRSLVCRFVDDGNASFGPAPMSIGWARYGISLVAEQPFWEGAPITRTFQSTPPQDFYGPPSVAATTQVVGDTLTVAAHGFRLGLPVRVVSITTTAGLTAGTTYFVAGTVTADTFQLAATAGGAVIDLTGADGTAVVKQAAGPPFTIMSGSNLASAAIDNPGDEPAFPAWTLAGPFTSASVGVGPSQIVVPFAMAAGESLVIDPRPSAQTAITGAGVDRTGDLGAVAFAPVEPGIPRPLSLSMVGAGSVTATLLPLYWRAW